MTIEMNIHQYSLLHINVHYCTGSVVHARSISTAFTKFCKVTEAFEDTLKICLEISSICWQKERVFCGLSSDEKCHFLYGLTEKCHVYTSLPDTVYPAWISDLSCILRSHQLDMKKWKAHPCLSELQGLYFTSYQR